MFDQADYDVRCEWGMLGLRALAPSSDVLIIVDVMSFSTCVSIAVARGAKILPFEHGDESAVAYARSRGAEPAGRRGTGRYSLSPASYRDIAAGTRVLLPSPNGGSLSLAAGEATTFTGCLRNAASVARAASARGRRIGVIPAGERWKEDGSLRPAIEDLLGAGAIISHLTGILSPEAEVARRAYAGASHELAAVLEYCSSGRELAGLGYRGDVALAAELNADRSAPILADGAYTVGARS